MSWTQSLTIPRSLVMRRDSQLPPRLLVVDPNEWGLDFFSFLTEAGWRIDWAHSSEEALELSQRHAYKIAIIELRLPDQVGTETWWQLKAIQSDMYAIIVTTSPSLHTHINVSEPRVLAFLLKPLEPLTVSNLISAVTESQHQNRTLDLPLAALERLVSLFNVASSDIEFVNIALGYLETTLKPDWILINLLTDAQLGWAGRFWAGMLWPGLRWTKPQSEAVEQLILQATQEPTAPVRSHERQVPKILSSDLSHVGLGSILVAPLQGRYRIFGALSVVSQIGAQRSFSTAESDVVALVSSLLSLVLEIVALGRWQRQAGPDRGNAIERRNAQPFSMIILKYPEPKAARKTQAKDMQDHFITGVVKIVKSKVRQTDVVAQLTDTAIAILVPGTSHRAAHFVASRVAKAIEAFGSADQGRAIRITTKVVTGSEPERL